MEKIAIEKFVQCCLVLALLAPTSVLAGNLEATAAPSDAASAVYNTNDIFNRLQAGSAGTKRTGGFTEPSAGPADEVGKTMDEIMSVAPTVDNVNGATQADVKTGKTFWGLRTDGTWGPKMGTANPALVQKSGQTTCYGDTGNIIACADTGQDGDKLKGVALPTPRFTDNSNGTVTDNLTGLIWLKNAGCATVSAKAWTAALTAVATLRDTMCGLTDGSVAGDWRVPNIKELSSLMNLEYVNPALSNTAGTAKWTAGNPFSGVMSTDYWSSTDNANTPALAWYVYLYGGTVDSATKSTSKNAWPVRGGQ